MDSLTARSTRLASALLLLSGLLVALAQAPVRSMPLQGASASGGNVCRAYSTDETRVSSGPTGKTGTMQIKCKYDTSTNQHVCHEDYAGASGPGYSLVQTTQFASVADVVGDPAKISFFTRAQTLTVKFPASTTTQVYGYDSRGHLASITTRSNAGSGGASVQTFSAWDALGRPTAGRDEVQDFIYTYDDAQRVFTQRSSGSSSLITLKFDANGNHESSVSVHPGFKDTTIVTVHATEQICRK